ncbi:YidC/Oxa1 family membrane protein insertase [bacterium]|nr:YidC/Oxa1 family membrane protein insertase [bacterium]
MKEFFHTTLYQPIYNTLVFLVDILPGGDVGIAIILLTVAVKLLLFPLAQKSIRAQRKMRELEPKLKELKEKYKDNREKQALLMMELYKKEGINPFSGIFLILLQLPIILALYFVFLHLSDSFDPTIIYSFLAVPENVNFNFLGFLDLTQKSVILALAAAVTQYFQIKFAMPAPPAPPKPGETQTFQEEFMRNMSTQMRYIFPVMVFVIAYTISSAIALYWTVSNLFMIGQELWGRRKSSAV